MPKKPKWNESPCPECKEPVAVDATRCPHCQAVYEQEVVEDRKKNHADSQKWGYGCVALIALLFLGMCAVGSSDDTKDSAKSSDATAPIAGSASPEVVIAVKSFNDEIMAAVSPCDDAGKAMAQVADRLANGGASVYDGFNAANAVENACRASWSKVSDIEIPQELKGAVREKAEETIDTCENAMIAKQMGGETMKEVFDGDMRPSKMSEAQENASAAQAGALACVAGIFSTASQAGVDLNELSQ